MAEVFGDTSGWASWLVRNQPFHPLARDLMARWQTQGTSIITTNYVLVELVALLTSPLRIPREQQVSLVEDIKTVSWVEIVHIDPPSTGKHGNC